MKPRNTLALFAVDRSPDQPRGLYRKVSVGYIGKTARIIWEYKTAKGWVEAPDEATARNHAMSEQSAPITP